MAIKSFIMKILCKLKVLLLPRNVRCGHNLYIGRNSQISARLGFICIGNNVEIWRNCLLATSGGELLVGDNVLINNNGNIVCKNKVSIGDGCIFGPNLCIFDHNHCYNEFGVGEGFSTGKIEIGKECWIGANVTILKNTTIGDGCIIGAGAVLNGNIPSHSIVKPKRDCSIETITSRIPQFER